MKLGRLPRGLAVAAVAAVTVVPLAASAASAAPAAPTAYTVYGSARALRWAGSSSLPVGDLHVPFVEGSTNNLAIASSNASLAVPDETSHTMSGVEIQGLTCSGYAEKACKDPFIATAHAGHSGVDGGHAEQLASFVGEDGKFPGRINALTDCPGNCGDQLIHSVGSAAGPAGGLAGYVSIGSSSASHDLTTDDKGKLISTANSELDNVSIGPKNEVHFSRLITTAQAFGSGAENTKDGRADLRITDFFILDNPVELTRAGLRLANAGPSEQEAYDGAKVLLKKLRDRGINLELPNFDAQLSRTADHVTVDTQGLLVHFEQSVSGTPVAGLSHPLELGHSTAVVAALDSDGHIEVKPGPNGGMVVETTAPTSVPAAAPAGPKPSASVNPNRGGQNTGPSHTGPATGANKGTASPGSGTVNTPPPATSGGEPAVTTPDPGTSTAVDAGTPPGNPDEVALNLRDVQNKLGLRGAHSVSRAFGAFFGLGLILPLARFVIRRLG